MLDFARVRRPELMDVPDLDASRHRSALDALHRINRLSRSASQLWAVASAVSGPANRPLRVLDLACGGGDVALAFEAEARRRGVDAEVHGCDLSRLAVERAAERAAAADSTARFFRLDVLREPLPEDFDVVYCTLFLHHLGEDDAVELLRRMASAAVRMVIVQDLERCRSGYLLAYLGVHVLTSSEVARFDGPVSVRGAFTREEAAGLARRAGLDATIRPCWPRRYTLTWRRP